MTFSIRRKLFVLLAGLTAVVLTGVLAQVTSSLSAAILQKVRFDFGQTERVFQRAQWLRYESLRDAAALIGENPSFKANVSLDDPASVYQAVSDMALMTRAEILIVTDAEGRLLAWFGDEERHGEDLTDRESIVRVLRGDERPNAGLPELWHTADGLFQVATVPVLINYETLIGTLTLGASLSRADVASELKGESEIDITFLAGQELLVTTAEGLTVTHIDSFRAEAAPLVAGVIADLQTSDVFEGSFAGREVFAFLSPLGFGVPAYYVATAIKSRELGLITQMRDSIFVTGALSLVITVVLALGLGRRLTQPILDLVGGMNQVTEGDLSVTLRPTTKDEIGLLTSTFNDMIVNLRERLQLMKYVGSHTVDMIQQTDGVDVPLGGSRHELAVLFTDIRGFTPFSEKREPEEVITMLNRYLGFQAEIVQQTQGSVDKFVGDEMMALFTGVQALDRAVDCAQKIMRRVEVEHASDPRPIHIGINCGPAILGNMGAQNRMVYTAIGVTVNLGARLMQVAGPGQLLLPAALLEQLRTPARVLSCEAMAFKGLSEKIEVADVAYDEEAQDG